MTESWIFDGLVYSPTYGIKISRIKPAGVSFKMSSESLTSKTMVWLGRIRCSLVVELRDNLLFFSHTSRSISGGPISMSNVSLIRSDVIPVLNILEILTTLEE